MTAMEKLPGRPTAPPVHYDFSSFGYVQEEFVLSGDACSYQLDGERTADGRWSAHRSATASFTTRMVVRRPSDSRDASGIAVLEWLNVTGGTDIAPVWAFVHRHLVRRGHTWIGISAQKAGIDGGGLVDGVHLKKADSARYGLLTHPGDAWSFDILTHAGRVARQEVGAHLLLAVGESQSAMYLLSYANAIDPLERVFDGFFIHGCGSCGAPFDGSRIPLGRAANAAGERIRQDVRVPTVSMQSETDVVTFPRERTASIDGAHLVEWEVAGAAHGDTYLLVAGDHDDGLLAPRHFAELLAPTTTLASGTAEALINCGPQQHYVAQAALDWLEGWATGGPVPPSMARLDRLPSGEGFQRDASGIATGGLRTPWVDVPTATLSGLGQRSGSRAMLFGTTSPFTDSELARRYPGGRSQYVREFGGALTRAIDRGVVLAEDRDEILAVAEASFPGGAAPEAR